MSMNVRELDDVLQKVAELRVFFDFGQKTVPLLDDVASFVSEIGPAVESMKALVHVASTKIPKASEQLVRVNQTSEQASNDILNTVDRMVSIIEEMENQGAAESSPESVRQTRRRLLNQLISLSTNPDGTTTCENCSAIGNCIVRVRREGIPTCDRSSPIYERIVQMS